MKNILLCLALFLFSVTSFAGEVPPPFILPPASTGSGNVVGPASSTTGDFPCYADATGKLLNDCGAALATTPPVTGGYPQPYCFTGTGTTGGACGAGSIPAVDIAAGAILFQT